MRHRKHRGRLGLSTAPRKALMRNLVEALIANEKVFTTQTRAAEVRRIGEKMITLARDGGQAARRRAFAFLRHKEAVHKLFEEIGPRFAERPGGYLRVVKEGPRQGDGAMMALVEMVDREIVVISEEEAEKKKSRARRLRDLRQSVRRT
ncbi:MAG TPA: 50S ribosomal protein L17 [Sumerlaeia bacterium]|nr:50S ribosomal protein L17 [Sumerlaeia bacterium]